MKKLLLLLFIAPVFGYGQGEQRYADGTATDQDGNTFEWINYGTQDWAIENAEVVTYRDGTPITQVTDATVWENLTTGAWCYYDNDPTKGKLYNQYAVKGIHDNDDNTPNKEFAPSGWRVSTKEDWDDLVDYVSATYNIPDYWIGKSLASTSGWMDPGDNFQDQSTSIGINQETNNISGLNIYPFGNRTKEYNSSEPIKFNNFSFGAYFWTSSQLSIDYAIRFFTSPGAGMFYAGRLPRNGFSVRFVREDSTASLNDHSGATSIYPNPTTSILTIEGDKEYDIEVYNMAGNKVMALTANSINMAHLSTATYIVKATDKSNNEELTFKVVKN